MGIFSQWYESAVRYEKTTEDGMQKKVTEKYLVNALSCTEAEAKTIKELTPFISGEFCIKSVKQSSINEVFANYEENDDKWYIVKLHNIVLDEKSGKEKCSNETKLVEAPDIQTAYDNFNEAMKGTMIDYVIDGIFDSKIIDVYQAESES